MKRHLDVHLVLDNSSTHKTPEVKTWLDRHPRFKLHFTPTSASWLNMVERFFHLDPEHLPKYERFSDAAFLILRARDHSAPDDASTVQELTRKVAVFQRDSFVLTVHRIDLAEIAAPVGKRHPVQFVSFAEVQANPGLHFNAGGPSAKRDLNVLIGKNVQAGRFTLRKRAR